MSKPLLQWLTADGEHAWTGSNDDCPDCYFVTSARTLYPTLWYAHVVRVKHGERPKVELIAEKLEKPNDAKAACERHWQGEIKREAIKRDFAEYNATTGEWQWKGNSNADR